MFLVFTLILLVVAIGILINVYSVFFPFMQNLGTVQQYHSAYYGAISSIERAELSLRYRQPGFEGSGGFFGTTGYGPLSDYTPELFPGDQEGFLWNITSRTSQIPSSSMGNTDPMLSYPTGDSLHYNQLGYHYLETLILSYDTESNPELYYSGSSSSLDFFTGGEFTGVIRFPPKVYDDFGGMGAADLCYSYIGANCDPDGDGIYDDVVISRSLQGQYLGQGFTLYPTMSVFYYSGMQVDTYKDNALRESIINNGGIIDSAIGNYTFVTNGTNLLKHTVVSSVAGDIENDPFSTILDGGDYTGLRFLFGATSLFHTFTGAIYPYLEYQFTFPQEIADRFYTIEGQGCVGEYDVHIILKKPTVQGNVGGDFTVIF